MQTKALVHGIGKNLKRMLGKEKEIRRGGLSKLDQMRISLEYDMTWAEQRRLIRERTET